ncbi:MAG: hypothetical protein ACREJD_08355 [Phycisphaerales bacterium]
MSNTETLTQSPDQPVAKTIERDRACFGVIGAAISETRFAAGGHRYGVVFSRDVGDLCLAGTFSMSLGQNELMDLIAAASTAYHMIDALRDKTARPHCQHWDRSIPFEQLEARHGWEPDHDEVFPFQIES